MPKSTQPILNLVRKLKQEICSLQLSSTKILVQCSYGVGQTGTFIALYQLIKILDDKIDKMFRKSKKDIIDNASFYLYDITIDVFETVLHLRSKRINMVSIPNVHKKYLCLQIVPMTSTTLTILILLQVQSYSQYQYLFECLSSYAEEKIGRSFQSPGTL